MSLTLPPILLSIGLIGLAVQGDGVERSLPRLVQARDRAAAEEWCVAHPRIGLPSIRGEPWFFSMPRFREESACDCCPFTH